MPHCEGARHVFADKCLLLALELGHAAHRRSAPSRAAAPRGGGYVMAELVPCQGELRFGAEEAGVPEAI